MTEQTCGATQDHHLDPLVYPLSFFTVGTASDRKEKDYCFSGVGIGLCGPEQCGKSILLFEYGLSIAAMGEQVLLLCDQDKLRNLPLADINETGSKEHILRKIDLKYVTSGEKLLHYIARIHETPRERLPTVILVDDFTSWFRGDKGEIIRCICLLSETMKWLAAMRPPNRSPVPHYVITLDNRYLNELDRWLPLKAVITKHTSSVGDIPVTHGDAPLFSLSASHTASSNPWLLCEVNPNEASHFTIYYHFGKQKVFFAGLHGELARLDSQPTVAN